MNFNSLQFLVFLAVVLLLYWVLPHKARWALLLIASYYFYMSWNAWLVFLILGTTLVSYGAGILISKTESKGLKKFWLIATLAVCLGVLFFFKYFDFLLGSAIDFLNLFSLNLDGFALNLLLPVGISFYTFQTLSYVIDVYKGKFEAEKHFGYYALFVCYFPQLVAGPIERPGDLLPQLKQEHKLSSDDISKGLRIMLYGFFLKCAVADYLGTFVNNVFGNLDGANSLSVFCAGLLFVLQMFGDFAGYSLIATGTARMMGVKLTKNFDRPYLATSYTDFFHRWHITLTRWFTDYLYIPLGGSRKGKGRRVLNTFIVFFLCGLWHGANWTYVIWGLLMGCLISFESLLRKPFAVLCEKLKLAPDNAMLVLARRVLMWISLALASVIFRSTSIGQLGEAYAILFTRFSNYFDGAIASLGVTPLKLVLIALVIAGMCMLWRFAEYDPEKTAPQLLSGAVGRSEYAQKVSVYFYTIVAIAVFWFFLLASQGTSAFLYFQF